MRRQQTCPLCRSQNVRFSHRKGLLERIFLPLLFLRPYRCDDCDSRFFRSYRRGPQSPDKAHANEMGGDHE